MNDLKISMQKGMWATQTRNEAKLNAAFQVRWHVETALLGKCSLPLHILAGVSTPRFFLMSHCWIYRLGPLFFAL